MFRSKPPTVRFCGVRRGRRFRRRDGPSRLSTRAVPSLATTYML